MQTGMLWYDNDPKADLKAKIERAAKYYWQKYGRVPNLCFIHPTMLPATGAPAGVITIHTQPFILPNHFLIGVAEVSHG